mmetsp:Transcript_64852/g.116638  ORF Transcript_64852/g.116638 Transcript_64852/m.116638 type:complete len:1171 (-) Transcript_64852:18-3530(-)|eukprot:CAMPEP_0115054402 /NCGR_PEP_ID=MMETSP0227-20121206/4067_1 /TAXON_ID=89957 /ORGANISM="Polarella glacialis, Strain CCMP 1383" /LENGTH=1170 /DNA_ID=CAMNT_0002438859 /DNA_START=91 /DNA_END=3603 /DNA_ORIENTATION=+
MAEQKWLHPGDQDEDSWRKSDLFTVVCAEAFQAIDKADRGVVSRSEVIAACKHNPLVRALLPLPHLLLQEDGTRVAFDEVPQLLACLDEEEVEICQLKTFVCLWEVAAQVRELEATSEEKFWALPKLRLEANDDLSMHYLELHMSKTTCTRTREKSAGGPPPEWLRGTHGEALMPLPRPPAAPLPRPRQPVAAPREARVQRIKVDMTRWDVSEDVALLQGDTGQEVDVNSCTTGEMLGIIASRLVDDVPKGFGALTDMKTQEDISNKIWYQSKWAKVNCFAPMEHFHNALLEAGYDPTEVFGALSQVRALLETKLKKENADNDRIAKENLHSHMLMAQAVQRAQVYTDQFQGRTKSTAYTALCAKLSNGSCSSEGPNGVSDLEDKALVSLSTSINTICEVRQLINDSNRLEFEAAQVDDEAAILKAATDGEAEACDRAYNRAEGRRTTKISAMEKDFTSVTTKMAQVSAENVILMQVAEQTEEKAFELQKAYNKAVRHAQDLQERIASGRKGATFEAKTRMAHTKQLNEQNAALIERESALHKFLLIQKNQNAPLRKVLEEALLSILNSEAEIAAKRDAAQATVDKVAAGNKLKYTEKRLFKLEQGLTSMRKQVTHGSLWQELQNKKVELTMTRWEMGRLDAIYQRAKLLLSDLEKWLCQHGQAQVAAAATKHLKDGVSAAEDGEEVVPSTEDIALVAAEQAPPSLPVPAEALLCSPLALLKVWEKVRFRQAREQARLYRFAFELPAQLAGEGGPGLAVTCPESVSGDDKRNLTWGLRAWAGAAPEVKFNWFQTPDQRRKEAAALLQKISQSKRSASSWRCCLFRSSSVPARLGRTEQPEDLTSRAGRLAAAPAQRWQPLESELDFPRLTKETRRRLEGRWQSLWAEAQQLLVQAGEFSDGAAGALDKLGFKAAWMESGAPLARLRNVVVDGLKGLALLDRLQSTYDHSSQTLQQIQRVEAASRASGAEDLDEDELEERRREQEELALSKVALKTHLDKSQQVLSSALDWQHGQQWAVAGLVASFLGLQARATKLVQPLKLAAEEQENLAFAVKVMSSFANCGASPSEISGFLAARDKLLQRQRGVALDAAVIHACAAALSLEMMRLTSRSAGPLAEAEAKSFCQPEVVALPEKIDQAMLRLCTTQQTLLQARLHRRSVSLEDRVGQNSV